MRSHQLWPELEAASGETLYRRTGGLVIGSAATDIARYHGQPGFLAQTIALAQRFGIAHELLDAAAIRERFPAFLAADGERGYLEHDAGVLFPERIVAAQLAQASRHGATLRLDERVLSIAPRAGGVEVVTDRGRLSAARVVVTAGAWAPGLAGNAFGTRLRVLRQVLYWFGVDDPALYAPERCPVFIWMHGSSGSAPRCTAFRWSTASPGRRWRASRTRSNPTPTRSTVRSPRTMPASVYEDHARGRLRGITPRVLRTATCLYTSTPDASFLVRPHPESEAITFVSACSGHGFKHSAALGEALARGCWAGRPGSRSTPSRCSDRGCRLSRPGRCRCPIPDPDTPARLSLKSRLRPLVRSPR